jgi:hypothetical protein
VYSIPSGQLTAIDQLPYSTCLNLGFFAGSGSYAAFSCGGYFSAYFGTQAADIILHNNQTNAAVGPAVGLEDKFLLCRNIRGQGYVDFFDVDHKGKTLQLKGRAFLENWELFGLPAPLTCDGISQDGRWAIGSAHFRGGDIAYHSVVSAYSLRLGKSFTVKDIKTIKPNNATNLHAAISPNAEYAAVNLDGTTETYVINIPTANLFSSQTNITPGGDAVRLQLNYVRFDGCEVVGTLTRADGSAAASVWRKGQGWTSLNGIAGGLGSLVSVHGVSADGAVIFGDAVDPQGVRKVYVAHLDDFSCR